MYGLRTFGDNIYGLSMNGAITIGVITYGDNIYGDTRKGKAIAGLITYGPRTEGFSISGENKLGESTTGPSTLRPNIGVNINGAKTIGASTEIASRFVLFCSSN